MSYVKNYNVGQTKLDLPYANYIHELPLLSFGDVQHTINLSLVFNQQRKAAGDNSFNIASGFKLNMQKRIVKSNGEPVQFEEADGRHVELTYTCGVYTFDDKTQRILRSTSTGYEIEYPDFSKETFNSNGYITGVYSKYDQTTPFLTYGYTNGRLTSIVYRGTKTITLAYNSSNKLSSITYANKTINVTHGTDLVTVKHFSGVDYHLNSSGNNLIVHSADANASYSSTYSHRTTCTKTASTLTVKKEIGSKTVDTTTYDFLKVNGDKVVVLDVTNKDEVKTRAQFKDDELLYSYEVGLDNDGFVNNRYIGNVQINNVLNNNRDIHTNGLQKSTDGASISVGTTISLGTNSAHENNYMLSGWIKLAQDNGSDTIDLTVANSTISSGTAFQIPTPPVGKWTYFAIAFLWTQSTICVRINGVETKDFRLTFQPTASTTTNDDHVSRVGDVLILESSNTVLSPITDCQFYNGSTIIGGTVTMRDVLQYKINQMYGTHKNIIFYDDYQKAVTSAGDLCVKYTKDGTIHTVTVKSLAVGKLSYINGKEYLTKTNFYSDGNNNYTLITKSTINGALYKEDVYNSHLDIVSSTVDDATVHYDYNSSGLIVRQITAPKSLSKQEALENATRSDVMVKQYNYDSGLSKINSVIDEFGNTTIYTTDDTWGVVTAVTLPDGTVITDTYDDDKCALILRKFATGDDARNTAFTYSGGNLAGVTHTDNADSISFTFTHDKDKLVNIKKGTNMIEEHDHTDTTLDSYYPSKASTVYSVLSDFDKYGRLTQTDTIVKNVYDVMPEFDSDGNLNVKGANGSAVLATSKDLTNNQVSRYKYNNQNQLINEQIQNSAGTVVSEETFAYDAIGRISANKLTYDNGSKYVESDIRYEKEVTDSMPDGKIKEFTCRIGKTSNQSAPLSVKTTNTYNDPYGRLTQKSYLIGNKTFTKTIEYDKTRVKKVTDSIGGATEYQYDAMGRITKAGDMEYTYDEYGQLTEEKDVSIDKTIQYAYNGIGNIESVTTTYSSGSTSTQSFTHGNTATTPDRLTKFGTKSITYNSMGCPVSYNGKTYTWSKGKLDSFGTAPSLSFDDPFERYRYTYNAKGQRTLKSYSYTPGAHALVDYLTDKTSMFTYDNAGRLIYEKRIENYQLGYAYKREFTYLYDETGMIGFVYCYNGGTPQTYYYQRNLQGDVIGIYNTQGNPQAKYKYDAWGNCTITDSTNSDIANANAIRYRGYYWDSETGWYFLNARYYSPEWRRFISPDDTAFLDSESVNGLNLYCYCGNDPINFVDPSGNFPVLAVILGITAVVGLGLTIGGVASDNNLMTAIGLTMVAIPALISGGMALACVGATATMVIGGITAAAGIGTSLFASAEYQEAFTSNNWMSGTLGEGFYNGLMLTTASIATLGTFASLTASSLQIKKVLEVGKIRGIRAPKGYPGIRFVDKSGVIRSLEFHLPHQGHGIHLQLNNWWLNHHQYVGQYYRAFAKHFEIFKFWKGWF